MVETAPVLKCNIGNGRYNKKLGNVLGGPDGSHRPV